MKITIVGLGYVGTSLAMLISQNHEVVALDIDITRIDMINGRHSPVEDEDISHWLQHKFLNVRATADAADALHGAEFVIIATPTNYDSVTNRFDTSSVEAAVAQARYYANTATIIIKSTIPVGFTNKLRAETGYENILFSPEFLSEGHALHDNLFPSRIVVGEHSREAQKFAELLIEGATSKDIPVLFTGSMEAEAIKLFSNTYLAMRVAYFNELDSYAIIHNLDTREIINGVGSDQRIGKHYNNPSFGYGGYCLPKDTKQLLANYDAVPQNIIAAVVESNSTRKNFIADQIIALQPKRVGIYRLAMKTGSDNFRDSSIVDIMRCLKTKGIPCIVYEPAFPEETLFDSPLIRDLDEFKLLADLIITNRYSSDLDDVSSKVYSRDLFGSN